MLILMKPFAMNTFLNLVPKTESGALDLANPNVLPRGGPTEYTDFLILHLLLN